LFVTRVAVCLIAALWLSCEPVAKRYVEPRTRLRFVLVPAGKFVMGSPAAEAGRQQDERPHEVRISRAFYLSETEVSQRQWLAVMHRNPSSFVASGLDAPVEQVTWDDVQEFLRRLNQSGSGRYRLPTEAEWEYACRAGSTSPYSFGELLSTDVANYDGRYPLPRQRSGEFRGATTRVGSFPPNRWGLYDMHGNVWEWCADEYCPYPVAAVTDPVNQCGSPYKVIRGGSWYFGADSARSALRYTHEPHLRGFSIGFRVVREAS
jgi:formylglycine-generating enzyme required for sulfatase activity